MEEAKLNSESKEHDQFLHHDKDIKLAVVEKAIKNEEEERNFKTYLRLILPHVGLVLASIIYAVSGAFIFYAVEMKHEVETKSQSVRKVTLARQLLVDSMWNNSKLNRMPKEPWLREAERGFGNWTFLLYTAFKKEFVKYHHINTARILNSFPVDGDWYNFTLDNDDYNVWTTSSSIFFAWTTMATIGYGNIVPVTVEGRIICVFFALFGTPLAILTIGDLGKFLSESTIAGYEKYKKWRDALKLRFSRGRHALASENPNSDRHSLDSDFSSFEDLLHHKAQVPVVVVFAILLLYIALGGLLFSALEGWKYVDAFYFCFITLTTVGFGDLVPVPRNHMYLVIMLLYIGVGLAVTTMCIDLVGIHYLQKIHYFGRKFKGYDLLKLLRQKRMIERRMAMAAQAADIMQMYFDAEDRSPPSPYRRFLMEQELPIHQATPSITGHDLTEWPLDNVYEESLQSIPQESPISTAPSYYDRINMYEKRTTTRTSWSPSGPDISVQCSIPTPPSLYEREQMYAAMFTSRPESPTSFKYETGRTPPTPTPLGMSLMEDWDSYRELMELSKKARLSIPNINVEQPSRSPEESDDEIYPPSLLSPLEVDFGTPMSSSTTYSQPSSPSADSVVEFPIKVGARFREMALYPTQTDSGRASLATGSDGGNGPEETSMLFHQNLPIYAVEEHTVGSEHALQASFNCPTEFISQAPPTMVTENYCFVVDGDAVNVDTLGMDTEWWKPTSRPTHYYYSEDYINFRKVHIVTVRGRIVGARVRGVVRKQPSPPSPSPAPLLPSPAAPPPPPPSQARSPSLTVASLAATVSALPAPPMVVHKNVPLSNVFRVSRYYSYWKTCAHFHRIITVITPIKESHDAKFKRRVFYQFLWHRDAKEADKLRVAIEYSPGRQAQLLQPRGMSFSAGPPSTSSAPLPQSSGSGGSNPPSGSVSPRTDKVDVDDETGASSSGTQQETTRRSSSGHNVQTKRKRSSVFQLKFTDE